MSTKTIAEAAGTIPVRAEVDVLVAGGGLAGVSAAMAAARAGAKTLLIERNGFLGGVATAGLCCSVFNCFYTADHRLGVTGNAVEVTNALAAATSPGYERTWHRHKGHIVYDVEQAKLVLASLVEGAGADVLYDTVISGAVLDGSTLRGVIIESKSGREAILARVVVDTTGDSDVAARAGAPLHVKAKRPDHSFCFRLGRVDVDRFVQYLIDHPGQYPEYMDVDWTFDEALAQYRETGALLFPHGGAMQMDIFKQARAAGEYPTTVGMHDTLDACQMHALRDRGIIHVVTGFVHFDDLDVGKISRAMDDGRRMAFIVSDFFAKHVPGFEKSFVIATADDLGIRVSRWLDGETVFTLAMKENPTTFPDAIGRGVVERDFRKHTGERAWGVQTFTNDYFHIPYGCLVPRQIDGLLMGAGRSVSTENGWTLRVMGLTMVVGQGAGAAAAVAAKSGVAPRSVNVASVQSELTRQGVDLG
jgi:ribulose 1,5-bisphosphate synthetase/thiazole synthase